MNADMWRGVEDEPRARRRVQRALRTTSPRSASWSATTGGCGSATHPDGLVGDDGLIEVKSRRQKKHLQTILSDEVPAENMAQLQTGLLVSGREWIDYMSYCGGMPLWVKRVEPDVQLVRRDRGGRHHVRGQRRTDGRGLRDSNQGLPPTERVLEH